MQAYHYNHLRFYDGTISRQIDSEASAVAGHDIYLMPANSTDVKPVIQDGYTPRWNGKAWEQYADDKKVYGYTDNADGTINYYGVEHTEEELTAKNKGVDLSFADTEPVSVDGVYWLSADNPDYIEAKKKHDKDEAIAKLDAKYTSDRLELANYFLEATIAGDEELQTELKAEIKQLNADYDEARKKLEG